MCVYLCVCVYYVYTRLGVASRKEWRLVVQDHMGIEAFGSWLHNNVFSNHCSWHHPCLLRLHYITLRMLYNVAYLNPI